METKEIKAVSFLQNRVFQDVEKKIEAQLEIVPKTKIPQNENEYKLEVDKWICVNNVVCVYFDLASSTNILLKEDEEVSAKIFDSYIQSATQIFTNYECSYLDIQGDGGFALFSGCNHIQRALVSAITLKTCLSSEYSNNLSQMLKKISSLNLTTKIGIHIGRVLSKNSGIRTEKEKLWLGGLVSLASKICNFDSEDLGIMDLHYGKDLYKNDYIKISQDMYCEIKKLKCCDFILKSCGCGGKSELWKKITLRRTYFAMKDFYILKTNWCKIHGDDFSEAILGNKKRDN